MHLCFSLFLGLLGFLCLLAFLTYLVYLYFQVSLYSLEIQGARVTWIVPLTSCRNLKYIIRLHNHSTISLPDQCILFQGVHPWADTE